MPLEVWLQSRGIWEYYFAKLAFYGNEVCVRLLQVGLHREEARTIHVAKPALNFCVIEADVEVHYFEVPVCGPTDYAQPHPFYPPFCRLDDVVDVLLYCSHGSEGPKKVVERGEQN